MTIARTSARTAAALVVGAVSAAVHLLLALPVAAALLVPALRPAARRAGGRLAAFERWRVTTLLRAPGAGIGTPTPERALRYLAARLPVGLLGGAVLGLLGLGLVYATAILWSWITRLRMSMSAVEKHVASIFGRLGIADTAGYSRRVLAVLRYLGS